MQETLVRAAVDVMGGDKAPQAILQGCWDAAGLLGEEDLILLVGDEAVCQQGLERSGLREEQRRHYRVVHAPDVIAMDDPPVEAIRAKPHSSISVMCRLASKGMADAVISAGNTGACVAAAQLRMRTLPGVSRPGIAITIPTAHGPVVLCDVGANIAPRPKHYEQYGIMAAAYAQAMFGMANPRVGLLSIGEEDAKGTAVIKAARKLMRDEPQINFVGNVEGRDIFGGGADVVVCDGFVGNIILKFTEGITQGLFQTIAAEVATADGDLAHGFAPILAGLRKRYDWQEYGGAPLLGVGGYCLIAHGRSDARAIMNAIRVARQLVTLKVNEKIVETIDKSIPVAEDEGVQA
jgi:glycerol-3-phosphate acyltransferase PlsX